MTAVLNVCDNDGFFRLGTFSFNSTDKYKGKAFFSFDNGALYRTYIRLNDGERHNHICDFQYVCDFYGLEFNNITEVEIAFDSTYNYVSKIRRMIKDIDRYEREQYQLQREREIERRGNLRVSYAAYQEIRRRAEEGDPEAKKLLTPPSHAK